MKKITPRTKVCVCVCAAAVNQFFSPFRPCPRNGVLATHSDTAGNTQKTQALSDNSPGCVRVKTNQKSMRKKGGKETKMKRFLFNFFLEREKKQKKRLVTTSSVLFKNQVATESHDQYHLWSSCELKAELSGVNGSNDCARIRRRKIKSIKTKQKKEEEEQEQEVSAKSFGQTLQRGEQKWFLSAK